MTKVGIIGLGHVGSSMHDLFPNGIPYDEPLNIGTKEEINSCDISFICVPTPQSENGSCDTSIVEDVLSWLDTPVIVIHSTVPVGFTDEMKERTGKHIIFQPEYYGETVNHPFADAHNRSWITLGGDKTDCIKVANLYKTVFTSELKFYFCDAKTAELAKYMENSFFAVKVSFCNQFYDLAENFGISYDELREVWLADPRNNRSHTFVYPDNRGYGGSCLPKDISSIIHQADEDGVAVPLLKATQETNRLYH